MASGRGHGEPCAHDPAGALARMAALYPSRRVCRHQVPRPLAATGRCVAAMGAMLLGLAAPCLHSSTEAARRPVAVVRSAWAVPAALARDVLRGGAPDGAVGLGRVDVMGMGLRLDEDADQDLARSLAPSTHGSHLQITAAGDAEPGRFESLPADVGLGFGGAAPEANARPSGSERVVAIPGDSASLRQALRETERLQGVCLTQMDVAGAVEQRASFPPPSSRQRGGNEKNPYGASWERTSSHVAGVEGIWTLYRVSGGEVHGEGTRADANADAKGSDGIDAAREEAEKGGGALRVTTWSHVSCDAGVTLQEGPVVLEACSRGSLTCAHLVQWVHYTLVVRGGPWWIENCELRNVGGAVVCMQGAGVLRVVESVLGGEGPGDLRTRDCCWLLDCAQLTLQGCRVEFACLVAVVCWQDVYCAISACWIRHAKVAVDLNDRARAHVTACHIESMQHGAFWARAPGDIAAATELVACDNQLEGDESQVWWGTGRPAKVHESGWVLTPRVAGVAGGGAGQQGGVVDGVGVEDVRDVHIRLVPVAPGPMQTRVYECVSQCGCVCTRIRKCTKHTHTHTHTPAQVGAGVLRCGADADAGGGGGGHD